MIKYSSGMHKGMQYSNKLENWVENSMYSCVYSRMQYITGITEPTQIMVAQEKDKHKLYM